MTPIIGTRTNLLNSLHEFCGSKYLPFTTKRFNSTDEIITNFLYEIYSADLIGNGINCIVPTFYILEEFFSWRIKPFRNFFCISSISKEQILNRFTLEVNWSGTNDSHQKSFSGGITEYLNKDSELNGRIKVRLKLVDNENIDIEYDEVNKWLIFSIPKTLKPKYHESVLKSTQNKTEIFNLTENNNRSCVTYPKIPDLNEAVLNEKIKNTDLKNLVQEIYLVIIKHSIYLEENIDLIYLFSNIANRPDKISDVGLGGMFLLVDNQIIDGTEEANQIVRYLCQLTDSLSARIVVFYQIENIILASRKAAISQVFARTGSHNLGSHVLAKMTTNDSVNAYFSWNNTNYTPIIGLTDVAKESAIANFNSYMRDRMDFLADLSTATPLMEVSKSLMADVISGMDRNRILMNFISGVSKFEYTLQIRDCRACDTINCSSPCPPFTVSNGITNDIQVSMPNDVMGFQALYIIIENVIRNTAKHGGALTKVDFTLEVRPCKEDDTLYEVWLYDSIEKNDTLTEKEKKEYKELTNQDASESTIKIDLIVARQNVNINKDILDPQTNELRHGAWGIIEMEVAAAYLRKISVETVDEQEYKVDLIETNKFYIEHKGKKIPNIIKAVNKNGCLGYVFHLMKPKELLVVDEVGTLYNQLNTKEESASKTKLEQLKEHGIWITNTDKNSPDQFNDIKVYPHPFMIVIPKNDFDDKQFLKLNNLYKGNLPSRILVQGKKPQASEENRWVAWTNDSTVLDPRNDINPQRILEEVWRIWLKHLMSFLDIESVGSVDKDPVLVNGLYAKKFNENVLDNHNDQITPTFNFCIDNHGKEIHNVFKEKCLFDHYEAYPSSVNNFLEKAEEEQIPNCQLIDGIMTNIVVVDERVQAIYQEDYKPENGNSFTNNERRMKAANIYIPAIKAINLNQTSFNPDDENKLHQAINEINSQASLKKGIDLIVIHLGVIERILEAADKTKRKEDVLAFIQRLALKFDARVIITSGRGKPDNLPYEVPFLAYSSLSHYSIQNPFKAFLNQALQSSRTFNNK